MKKKIKNKRSIMLEEIEHAVSKIMKRYIEEDRGPWDDPEDTMSEHDIRIRVMSNNTRMDISLHHSNKYFRNLEVLINDDIGRGGIAEGEIQT